MSASVLWWRIGQYEPHEGLYLSLAWNFYPKVIYQQCKQQISAG
ncbi:hypothetical protein JCM19240_3392 [Vibrio maritimus]|uniref:Uncharacterized protein n=1 Tax=Vibrio maritimus TaxID=990268 RepID=A0A090TVT8_9VIBR|nr:hypothetical protein JCM19240_3392 [Vibrio maritimus]